ncbi:MAG: UpxY family transcription antiterminator [Saprospiraceae bacterium]|nr:UpxY family transcription antiterminator [Saprospiraceae bacterium]
MKNNHPTNHLDPETPRWFAVYTHFKREKVVERMLRQKGIECYLPLQKQARKYTRKFRIVELPLISCYLFVKITKAEYVPVLETEHVLNFVKFSRDLIAIPEEEIDLIKRIVGEGLPIEVEQGSIEEGDWVEIISGNLTGLKGRMVAKEGKNQFVVELDQLGYSIRMTLDPKLLHKLNKPVRA